MVDIHVPKQRVRVLPVYPRFPTTFWSFKHAIEFVGKRAIMPPTGLATVAAMLPEDYFEVMPVNDLNLDNLDEQAIKDSDLIMTSTMIVQENSHNEVIDRAHDLGKLVLGGGPLPTSYPDRTEGLDFSVTGEAEVTLMPFVQDFLSGKARKRYEEKDVINEGRINMDDILSNSKTKVERSPTPRFDLLDLERYYTVPVQYSRGCPFNCAFCDITTLYGRLSRTKTPSQVTKEFDTLLKLGYNGSVFIVDDNFIGNKGKVKRELLPAMIEWQEKNGRPLYFNTEASMNLAWDSNKEILDGMVEAGFHEVFVGIESPDEEVLMKMSKGQNTKMPPLEAVKKIQEAGLTVTGGFIVGSDGDKPTFRDSMFNFIQEAGIVVPMAGLLSALKNTDLYNRLKEEGRLREESKGDNTHHLIFNFEPELDESLLINDYVRLTEDLFEPKNYYERASVLRDRKGRSIAKRKIGLDEIGALGKTVARFGEMGGVEFGKYLWDTLKKKPSYLASAIADGAKLVHFSRLTKQMSMAHEFSTHAESLYERFMEYPSEINNRFKGRLNEGVKYLERKGEEIIMGAREKYESIHIDYRPDARNFLDGLTRKIESEIERYRSTSIKI